MQQFSNPIEVYEADKYGTYKIHGIDGITPPAINRTQLT